MNDIGWLCFIYINGKLHPHIEFILQTKSGCGNPGLAATLRTQLNSAAILDVKKENINFLTYEHCMLPSYPIRNVQKEICISYSSNSTTCYYYLGSLGLPRYDPIEGMGRYWILSRSSKKWPTHFRFCWLLDRAWSDPGAPWKIPKLYFWSFNPSRVPDFFVGTSQARRTIRK